MNWFSTQNQLQIFFLTNIIVAFAKNILVLSNPDSNINFKHLVILTLTLTLNIGDLGFYTIFSVK